ncbi:hypothetical protein PVAP13_9KG041815 [Panicum virgatum]|uniref:Uncharacterized protein n=1 Tax=Panicum virgatum TaxID=38727 RepID=A0A8T0N8N8_PANVG|nr:hypothetical protein PVAP13_9KG041815 [Panicum virgatum]
MRRGAAWWKRWAAARMERRRWCGTATGAGAGARGHVRAATARADAASPVLAVSARPGGGAVVRRAGRRCGGAVWRRRVAGSRGRRREMELRQRALWSCDSGVPVMVPA